MIRGREEEKKYTPRKNREEAFNKAIETSNAFVKKLLKEVDYLKDVADNNPLLKNIPYGTILPPVITEAKKPSYIEEVDGEHYVSKKNFPKFYNAVMDYYKEWHPLVKLNTEFPGLEILKKDNYNKLVPPELLFTPFDYSGYLSRNTISKSDKLKEAYPGDRDLVTMGSSAFQTRDKSDDYIKANTKDNGLALVQHLLHELSHQFTDKTINKNLDIKENTLLNLNDTVDNKYYDKFDEVTAREISNGMYSGEIPGIGTFYEGEYPEIGFIYPRIVNNDSYTVDSFRGYLDRNVFPSEFYKRRLIKSLMDIYKPFLKEKKEKGEDINKYKPAFKYYNHDKFKDEYNEFFDW